MLLSLKFMACVYLGENSRSHFGSVNWASVLPSHSCCRCFSCREQENAWLYLGESGACASPLVPTRSLLLAVTSPSLASFKVTEEKSAAVVEGPGGGNHPTSPPRHGGTARFLVSLHCFPSGTGDGHRDAELGGSSGVRLAGRS